MNTLEKHAKQYTENSEWSMKTHNDYFEYTFDLPEGTSKSVIYNIFPGIQLIFFDIHAKTLPADPNSYVTLNICQFNYCISGRIESLLDDNTYFYLTENNWSVSRQNAGSASYFPTNSYQGINIFFDMHLLCNSDDSVLTAFGLDFSKLAEIYFKKRDTFLSEANQELKIIIEKIWGIFDAPSIFYARLYTLEFLHLFLSDQISGKGNITFYPRIQVDIAKKAEQLLTADLSKHIPIRQLAEQLSVSETSLKNYFKSVYGQNISDYMSSLRMNTASHLLIESTLSVAEIANRVGYTKQGKFAAVFKKQFGLNPLAYRRNACLEKL